MDWAPDEAKALVEDLWVDCLCPNCLLPGVVEDKSQTDGVLFPLLLHFLESEGFDYT